MGDASRVGEARRHAQQLAHEAGLDEVQAGRVAIVVTELGTNLLRHAREGRLLIAARPEHGDVEIVAMDAGPGIPDLRLSMNDGFSTGGTPGTGLGAVRRLARDFDIHSTVPGGTVVVARVGHPPAGDGGKALCFSSLALAAPGERVCGDGCAFAFDGPRAAVLMVDGLGHGPDAAEAAAAAVEVFREDPFAGPRDAIQRAHARLRSTRGAALTVLHLDAQANTVRSAGAGNVLTRLFSGVADKTILTQHGTAGVTIRTPEEITQPWPPHAMLVSCTDGIDTRWKSELLVPVLGRDPMLAAALLMRDHCRGRDDATVAVLRRKD